MIKAASLSFLLIATSCLETPIQAAPEGPQSADSEAVELDDEPMTSEYLAELAAAGLGTYSREDAYADSLSIERAMSFMDGVAVSWGNKFGCVTCHTNGFYLTSPASFFSDRPAYREAQEQERLADFEKQLTQFDEQYARLDALE